MKGSHEWLEQHRSISPLIERLGHRLDFDLSASSATAYLIEGKREEAGIKFDRAQGIEVDR